MSTLPKTFSQEQLRDLGFGSVVSQEQSVRLLNRDGSFNVKRRGFSYWDAVSSYHALLTMSWVRLGAFVTLSYFVVNLLFAFVYGLCGSGALQQVGTHGPVGLSDAFFFSVQTLSTIGSSTIVPTTVAANLVVTMELLTGLLGFAIAAGVVFARFSRPSAKIIYSQAAVIAPYQGMNAFEFRVTNARDNQLIEVEAKVLFTRFESQDGKRTRKYYFLDLERERVTFLPLAWTIVHPIDDSSPLKNLSREDMVQAGGEFLILLTAIDETFSQTVHSRSSYLASEVFWGGKFANLFSGMEEQLVTIDMRKFHQIDKTDAGRA